MIEFITEVYWIMDMSDFYLTKGKVKEKRLLLFWSVLKQNLNQ